MRKRFARIKSKEKLLQQQRRKKHIKLTAGSDTVNQTQNKNENEKEGAVSYAEDRLIAGEKQSFMSAGTQLKQKSEKLRKKQAQISAVQRKNRNVNRSYQRSIFRRRGETAAQQGVKRAKQTAKRIKNAFEMLIASSRRLMGRQRHRRSCKRRRRSLSHDCLISNRKRGRRTLLAVVRLFFSCGLVCCLCQLVR